MAQNGTENPPSYNVSVVNPPKYISRDAAEFYSDPYTTQSFSRFSGRTHLVSTFNDHMSLAIFATLFCFFPLGIVAILRATEARAAMATQDITRAQRLSSEARRLSNISICIGSVISVVLIIGLTLLIANNHDLY